MKRQIYVGLVTIIVLVALQVSPLAPDQAAGASTPAVPQEREAPAGLSAKDWASMQNLMQAAQYQVTWQVWGGEWAYRAPNRAHGLALAFAVDGFTATRHGAEGESLWEFGLALSAYGDEVYPSPISRDALTASRERVEYRWDDHVTEWYENSPAGVEHGLTLEAPPKHGDVGVSFALFGNLTPRLDPPGQALSLLDGQGQAVLKYDRLAVYDATGRELVARLELAQAGDASQGTDYEIRIAIDAGSAVYPLTVDPLLYTQAGILRASDAQAGDLFGGSVSISGDTVVVGAEGEDGGPGDLLSYAGAAYVFERNHGGADGWGQVRILRASDAQAGDLFGASVSISGDKAVVGADGEDGGAGDSLFNAGAAYVFERNHGGADGWGQVAVLHASDAQAHDGFGYSVSISGDTVVGGALGEDGGAGDPLTAAGAAYVFEHNQGGADGWGQVRILRASDAQEDDRFGASVSISGDRVVIGAAAEDGGAGDPLDRAGAAYVFERNQGGADQWGQVTVLRSSDAQEYDSFGSSVSISGDTAVIGALGEDGGGGDPLDGSGATYVFERNQGGADQWGEVRILRASDAQAGDFFGSSVSISGDTVVVGAEEEDGGAGDLLPDAGAVYVFERNEGGADQWGEVRLLRAADAEADDYFGTSVSISGDTVVVGAHNEDGGAGGPVANAGAAYLFAGSGVWQQVAIGRDSDTHAGDNFGYSVSISGDTAVVGAYGEDGGWGNLVPDAGAAYLFVRNQGGVDAWGEARIFRASDAQEGDRFGVSVSVSGDTVVVGASHEDGGAGDPYSNAGAAYVFERNQGGADRWWEVTILHALDAQMDDNFGTSVSISGDTLVVGAVDEDGGTGDPLSNAGAAYVFERNQGGMDHWGQVAALRATDRQGWDRFGISVSISDDTVVVGALYEDGGTGDPISNAGAAYVFERNRWGADQWGQMRILRASEGQVNDYFGHSVSISGDTVIIGAFGENGGPGDPFSNAGAAYVFGRNQGGADHWEQVCIVRTSDPQAGDHFGSSVSISGDTVVVGAPQEDGGAGDPHSNAGAAYVFERNQGGADGWGQVCILRPADTQEEGLFGTSVSISGDVLTVGAEVEGAGAAYFFRREAQRVYLPLVLR